MSIYSRKVLVLSRFQILDVLVSEGVVSVSEGVVSVSDGQVLVSDNEVLTTMNPTQRTAPQVKMNAVQQCSSWCREGNSSTATHCNADALEMKQSLSIVNTNMLSKDKFRESCTLLYSTNIKALYKSVQSSSDFNGWHSANVAWWNRSKVWRLLMYIHGN